MTVRLVTVAGSPSEHLEYAARHLGLDETQVEPVALVDRLPRSDREGRHLEARFVHTPEPLLASWRASRSLMAMTSPGDIVLMPDRAGLGGVFALMQATERETQRRLLWTVAFDSAFLELQLVTRTHTGFSMPLESQVDWEVVQYQWSDRVIATSSRAARELSTVGVDAEVIGSRVSASGTKTPSPRLIWAPGPVSRRNQTGDVLRAASSVPSAHIVVSTEDSEDKFWSGTTWEALRHVREVLGARVERGDVPTEEPTAVVLGDPFALPAPHVEAMRSGGVPIIVPAGSVAAQMWEDAPIWSDVDELAGLLSGLQSQRRTSASLVSRELRPPAATAPPRQITKVSVAIPVFRNIAFLRDCVDSVLQQDHAPHEVILVDDGSDSVEVAGALAELERNELVRVHRTSHRGVCAARNSALETMEGDSCLFVDSDDLIRPTFLAKCVELMNRRHQLWGVATWTEFFGAYEGIEAKPPFDARVGARENPIVSTCALVDLALVRGAGIRFADDLAFLYCEDWHFWAQIVAAGGTMGLVSEPLALHRVYPTSGGYLRTQAAHEAGRSRAIAAICRHQANVETL